MCWRHAGCQILRRVVRVTIRRITGIPQVATQQWLVPPKPPVFSAYPFSAWLSTSSVRQEAEAVRRNAYWRLFGLDLAFGGDDNRPPVYDRAEASNSSFVRLFEELLYELWKAMSNVRNIAGENQADDDRIFRLTEELAEVLRSRRQQALLAREELAAATVLGWVELTLSTNTPVVQDLRANATAASDRLQLIAQRVGMAAAAGQPRSFRWPGALNFLRFIEVAQLPGRSRLATYLQAGTDRHRSRHQERHRRVIEGRGDGDLKLSPRPVPVQLRSRRPPTGGSSPADTPTDDATGGDAMSGRMA